MIRFNTFIVSPQRNAQKSILGALLLPLSMAALACDGGPDGPLDDESDPLGQLGPGEDLDPLPQTPPPQSELLADGPTIVAMEVSDRQGNALRDLAVHHPVNIDLWLAPDLEQSQGFEAHRYHIGLVEKHEVGAEKSGLLTCQLGVAQAAFGPQDLDANGRYHLRREFVVPRDCLPADGEVRSFNLWVGTNPALETLHESPGLDRDRNLNTQFFNTEYVDSDGRGRNLECIGPDGAPGCIIDLAVSSSPGVDVSIDQMGVDNQVLPLR